MGGVGGMLWAGQEGVLELLSSNSPVNDIHWGTGAVLC